METFATREVVGTDTGELVVGALSVPLERAGWKPERAVTHKFVDVDANLEVAAVSVSLECAGWRPEGLPLQGCFEPEGTERS